MVLSDDDDVVVTTLCRDFRPPVMVVCLVLSVPAISLLSTVCRQSPTDKTMGRRRRMRQPYRPSGRYLGRYTVGMRVTMAQARVCLHGRAGC